MKPIDESLLRDATAYIERWVEHRRWAQRIPGVAIAVGFRGQVLLARAYGLADIDLGTALTNEHVFRVASISKTFTATAVMQLAERGRLRLDDRAGDALPWLPSSPGQIGRATVRQLLSHSAGVVRDGVDAGFWRVERDFPAAAEFRDLISGIPPALEQNVQFKYSNFGYSLLGLLVEAAAGTPYNAYVQEHIIDRLGLESTGPELDDRARERLATGYTAERPGLPHLALDHLETGAMSPAAGFYSTAGELCRYGAAHCLGTEELLTDESKREMQRRHWRIDGFDHTYGLGLDVYRVGERRLVGHPGGFPGFVSHLMFDPEQQLVVVALINTQGSLAVELTMGMVRIIDRALAASPAEAPAAELDRLTGRYWSLGGVIDIARFGDRLHRVLPDLASPEAQLAELAPAEDGDFRIAADTGVGSPGERVRFVREGDGRVTRVQWAASGFVPWDLFESTVLPSVRASRRGPRRPVSSEDRTASGPP